MSEFEALKASARRIELIGTSFGVAIIIMAMVVSVATLINSDAKNAGIFTSSMVDIEDKIEVTQFLGGKSRWQSRFSRSTMDFKSSSNFTSVQNAIDNVSIFDRIFTGEELCIAQAVYFEARSEPVAGQMAVAEVINNRVLDRRYPSDACKVVFQNERRRHRCQFSFACDGKTDRPKDVKAWETALKVVALVSSGEISTLASKATHYHASYVKPRWRHSFNRLGKIGRHIFYSDHSA